MTPSTPTTSTTPAIINPAGEIRFDTRPLGDIMERYAVIGVHGRCMEPTIPDGGLTLLDLKAAGRMDEEGVYVIRDPERGLLVKRLKKLPGHDVAILTDSEFFIPGYPAMMPLVSIAPRIVGRVMWAGSMVK